MDDEELPFDVLGCREWEREREDCPAPSVRSSRPARAASKRASSQTSKPSSSTRRGGGSAALCSRMWEVF